MAFAHLAAQGTCDSWCSRLPLPSLASAAREGGGREGGHAFTAIDYYVLEEAFLWRCGLPSVFPLLPAVSVSNIGNQDQDARPPVRLLETDAEASRPGGQVHTLSQSQEAALFAQFQLPGFNYHILPVLYEKLASKRVSWETRAGAEHPASTLSLSVGASVAPLVAVSGSLARAPSR